MIVRRMIIALVLTAAWFVICITISGCVAMPKETLAEEAVYQTTIAVDAAETVRIARSRGEWMERNPWLGERPRSGNAIGYFVACGIAHAALTDYLVERGAPAWLIRAWELGTIAYEARALQINAHNGVSP